MLFFRGRKALHSVALLSTLKHMPSSDFPNICPIPSKEIVAGTQSPDKSRIIHYVPMFNVLRSYIKPNNFARALDFDYGKPQDIQGMDVERGCAG